MRLDIADPVRKTRTTGKAAYALWDSGGASGFVSRTQESTGMRPRSTPRVPRTRDLSKTRGMEIPKARENCANIRETRGRPQQESAEAYDPQFLARRFRTESRVTRHAEHEAPENPNEGTGLTDAMRTREDSANLLGASHLDSVTFPALLRPLRKIADGSVTVGNYRGDFRELRRAFPLRYSGAQRLARTGIARGGAAFAFQGPGRASAPRHGIPASPRITREAQQALSPFPRRRFALRGFEDLEGRIAE